MKKACVAILALLLIASPAWATETTRLTLSEAVSIGLKNNLDIQLFILDLEEAQVEADRAYLVGDITEVEKALETYERTLETLEKAEEDLILRIERSYYDLQKSQNRLIEQSDSLLESKRQYELDEARFEAGLISELSLLRASNSLLAATMSYENLCESFLTSQYRFNELLGLDLSMQVELIDKITLTFTSVQMDLQQALDIALRDSDTMQKASESFEKAVEDVRLADNEYTPRADLERALVEKKRAEIALIKAKQRVFFDVRTAYLAVKQQEATIQLKKEELTYAEDNLAVSIAQSEAGVISENALRSAQTSFASAEQALIDALWEHVSARRNLLSVIGNPESVRKGYSNEP